MPAEKRLGGLDRGRLAGAFLVAAIHISPLAPWTPTGDFLLTRVLARTAVPFFLMITGYFLLPPFLSGGWADWNRLWRYQGRLLALYVGAAALYLPVNLYAGQLRGLDGLGAFRLLAFDGTFYHLWYLPAAMLGVLLTAGLGRRLALNQVLAVSAALYLIGLGGDSYWKAAAGIPAVRAVYERLFLVSSYTRNGLFYAPLFLTLGAWLRNRRPWSARRSAVWFSLFLLLMAGEALALRALGWQRHDSMYLFLPPCMVCLFRLALAWKAPPAPRAGRMALWIYLLHPLAIVLVRGAAGVLGWEPLLVENALVHYLVVCLISFAVAAGISRLPPARLFQDHSRSRAWTEVDLSCLQHNARVLRSCLPPGCELMPAVKADAYGHGAVPVARQLQAMGVGNFCVATAREGISLRRAGIRGEILVLGYTPPEQRGQLRRWRLTQTVLDAGYGRALCRGRGRLRVQAAVDTGMHRLGQPWERMEELAQVLASPRLKVTGAFTHLNAAGSPAREDEEHTLRQAERFRAAVDRLDRLGCRIPQVHLLASAGVLRYPELGGDIARVGLALYGIPEGRPEERLRPVLALKARVACVREVRAGERAGYGGEFLARRDSRLAVLAIGYADGLPRALSNGAGQVLIRGVRLPVAGRRCMDQTLVDATDAPQVRPGDEAVLIGVSGAERITAQDVAAAAGTIPNEILSRLGSRLGRVVLL